MPDGRHAAISTPQEGAVAGRWKHVGLLLPALLSLGVVLLLDPTMLFRDSIPAMTDLPGQLLPPYFLATELLPHGQIHGWSLDWFAGYPVYYFYFPLPGIVIAALGTLLGPPMGLRIALLVPLVGLPWALHAFARWNRLPAHLSAGVVLGGSGMLLMSSYRALGGNIASDLSGELYYGWALLLAVLYLGSLASRSMGNRSGVAPGFLLAGSLLSHVLPALAVGVGVSPFLGSRKLRRSILESWVVCAVLSAFWLIPMVFRLDQVGEGAWAYAPGLSDILPLEIVLLLPAALAGLVLVRRYEGLAMLAVTGLFGVLIAWVPQSFVMRGRLLPMTFLAVHVLAGAGIAWGLRELKGGRWRIALPFVLVAGGSVGLLLAARGLEASRGPSDAVLEGLDSTPGSHEYAEMLDYLRTLPAGRIHWEPGKALARWGHAHAFSLIPYFTEHSTLSGLWRESSPLQSVVRQVDAQLSHAERTAPYPVETAPVSWDPPAAIEKLRWLGVRYLLTHTTETATAVERVTGPPLAAFGSLQLFELEAEPLVSAVPCVIGRPKSASRSILAEWVSHWTPGDPTVSFGGGFDPAPSEGCRSDDRGAVEVLSVEDNHIRFRTDRPGTPHLIRVSYFPNWRAEGARGPYLATPWFMLVVPQQEVVDLRFGATAVERIAWLVTVGGLLGIGLWTVRARRRRAPARA